MLAGYDAQRDRDPRHFDVASRVAGATFLLTLDHLVTVIHDSLRGIDHPPVVSDHPPAPERIAALIEAASGKGLPAGSLDLSEAYFLWLGNLVNEVAFLVRSKAEAQARSK